MNPAIGRIVCATLLTMMLSTASAADLPPIEGTWLSGDGEGWIEVTLDGDGLSDGEEVDTHGTDPLNPDTDGGGIDDGDEVLLGCEEWVTLRNDLGRVCRTGSVVVEEIFGIVKSLNENEGVSFLLAEQNTNVALRFAHYGYILESGRVVMDGPADALRENPDVKEFYLGMSDEGRKSFRDVRSYRRRKRWLS